MEPYFTRVTCYIKGDNVISIPKNRIYFYESPWDFRTNEFIKDNLGKINAALETYPSDYCYYNLEYIPQSTTIEFESEEEKRLYMERIAEEQRENSHDRWGIIYCALFQDKGRELSGEQRVLIINVEDNTPQAIIAAIRYLAQFANIMKNEVMLGKGCIPPKYSLPWKVDLAKEYKDLYDSAYDWLEGKNELYFSQPILKFDKDSHRMWFVDNHGNIDKEFVPHNLMAQAFYLLAWNHPEGIKDSDLYWDEGDNEAKERAETLRRELAEYYKILNPYLDIKKKDPNYYHKQVYSFCHASNREARDTARSRIKKAFKHHEAERVNKNHAEKVAEYYSFDATDGLIKVINRSTTIILPDSLMSDRLKKYNAEHADNADK